MDPQEFRFRGGRVALECALAAVLSGMAGAGLSALLRGPGLSRLGPPASGALFLALLAALVAFRWRSRIVIDRDGIERRRSRRRVRTRLAWEEVDEIFLLGPAEFELRGAGGSVRFAGPFSEPDRARELASARLGGMRELLRDRALRDGQLDFRMPVRRWQAHASYLLAILFLTVLTGLVLAPFLLKKRAGIPVLLVLFGGSWFWGLRRAASRLGTRVTLYRDGLLVRRLDGRNRIAWSELDSTEWDARGGLVLVLASGKKVPLPFNLANIAILEEFVEEGRRGAGR